MPEVLQCVEYGGPEKLKIATVDDLPLEPGEVRYDVRAYALNRADLMFMHGEHYTLPVFPARIGSEASGVVTQVGPGVTRFAVGDAVTSIPFHTLRHGVQGTSAVVPEAYLTRMPQGVDFVQGASVWMQYLTPWFAFTEVAKLQPGDTVLITAAAGTAGLGALQVAGMLGLRTVATVRNEAKAAGLREQGADEVVVVGRDDLAEAVQRVSDGAGLAASFDPIGGDSLFDYADLLARGASVMGYGTLSDEQPVVPVAAMARAKAVFHAYSMFNYVTDPELLERACAAISEGLERGVLQPLVDRVFSFDRAIEAYLYMQSNAQMGKIVVEVAKA